MLGAHASLWFEGDVRGTEIWSYLQKSKDLKYNIDNYEQYTDTSRSKT